MLRRVHVQNFKSIADLTLEPGQVNVLIGENGCGKSNFLEALAFLSAAGAAKLDNEFLASRGIRVTPPEFMRSAFKPEQKKNISFDVTHDENERVGFEISNSGDGNYPRWVQNQYIGEVQRDDLQNISEAQINTFIKIRKGLDERGLTEGSTTKARPPLDSDEYREIVRGLLATLDVLDRQSKVASLFTTFLIYSPENSALRTFAQEGQVLPLGIKGEGLFKLLRFLCADVERWEELKSNLKMIDWFRDLKIASEQAPFEQTLQIHDRFLAKDFEHFDQRSANEGFLFLLFYMSLMISPDTPSIFAIDNIDASLNPKTATALTSRLAKLAKKYNKQIFLTTHSPAVLDGLDLTDPEHRLFVFQRNRKGETRCRRVEAPQPVAGETPVKLSEAFLRGLIGGLPQNF